MSRLQGLPRRAFGLAAWGATGGWPFFMASGVAAALDAPPTTAHANTVREAVRRHGAVMMMRHAQTVPGVGDPPGFQLGDCSTQRNLSDAGRAQAQGAGEWLRAQGLVPSEVRTSQWCRCRDTARLIAEALTVQPLDWPALNSFFDDRSTEPRQSAELRAALAKLKPGHLKLWVTHQVNATALSGEVPAMGEAFVFGPPPASSAAAPLKILARLRFAA